MWHDVFHPDQLQAEVGPFCYNLPPLPQKPISHREMYFIVKSWLGKEQSVNDNVHASSAYASSDVYKAYSSDPSITSVEPGAYFEYQNAYRFKE